jgi:tryptophanyl-tRNA synthetase
MGRNDSDELTAAQIFYPCMQCADIFFLKADICQLGMDQRKVNVLAREYCTDIKRKNKPIILSHRILICPCMLIKPLSSVIKQRGTLFFWSVKLIGMLSLLSEKKKTLSKIVLLP